MRNVFTTFEIILRVHFLSPLRKQPWEWAETADCSVQLLCLTLAACIMYFRRWAGHTSACIRLNERCAVYGVCKPKSLCLRYKRLIYKGKDGFMQCNTERCLSHMLPEEEKKHPPFLHQQDPNKLDEAQNEHKGCGDTVFRHFPSICGCFAPHGSLFTCICNGLFVSHCWSFMPHCSCLHLFLLAETATVGLMSCCSCFWVVFFWVFVVFVQLIDFRWRSNLLACFESFHWYDCILTECCCDPSMLCRYRTHTLTVD